MKAIIWTKYGSPDGLQLREVARPAPKDNEVLIKVHAATVSTPDTELRRLKLPLLFAIPLRLFIGFIKPTRITILGTEFAGEIESAGKDVTLYKPGDQVFGYTGLGMGTYAEYMCLAEKPSALASVMGNKPVNMSYEEAAAVPFGGLEALHSLGKIDVQRGQKVLIVGAGGSIGTWAVQLAKYYGAEVTGVDKPGKLEMLRSIGADQVIDYTREDFTKNGQTYDVIFDTIGKSPFSGSLRSLNEKGTYLNANPGLFGVLRWRLVSKRSSKKVIPWTAGYTRNNLLALKELIEAGKVKPVIDRRYPLEQAAEAHRYVDSGQKKGNVVITVEHNHKT
ncbi:MAG TPA: NAD(P)-dependent alcohol dehydrogenase [Anaerolineales bacterium]|nr:NAD(P)-dependent alcohol dehydrogenase [Anaerolineales bacterium]